MNQKPKWVLGTRMKKEGGCVLKVLNMGFFLLNSTDDSTAQQGLKMTGLRRLKQR